MVIIDNKESIMNSWHEYTYLEKYRILLIMCRAIEITISILWYKTGSQICSNIHKWSN